MGLSIPAPSGPRTGSHKPVTMHESSGANSLTVLIIYIFFAAI